jgi:hypothetical protein
MKELAPGIVIFEDIFPDSMEYLKKIEESGSSWIPAGVLLTNEPGNKVGTDYKSRDTDLVILPDHTDDSNNPLANFTRAFHESMKPCLDEYISVYGAVIEHIQAPQLLRYGKEQKFHNHVDDHPLFTRRISMTYYLNDDYEGGDVEFSKYGLRFKAKKNNLLIFPSNFMYNHAVHPVTDGLRYVVVQWTR